jgi:hypothetical protein
LDKSKDFIKGLNFTVITLGCLFLLVPTKLTGFCIAMICVDRYRPFTLVIGGVILALSIINALILGKKQNNMFEYNEN